MIEKIYDAGVQFFGNLVMGVLLIAGAIFVGSLPYYFIGEFLIWLSK